MSKNEWIESWTTGRFKDTDKKVIEFIAEFIFQKDEDGNPTDVISDVFVSGYCYYFANMLKAAFHRGEVCWSEGRSHIVWKDVNGVAYDSCGVYEDYDRLRPVSYLGNTIVSFMHNGEEYSLGSPDFTDWCKRYQVTEIFAITYIWQSIPREELDAYDSQPFFDNVEKVAHVYWIRHQWLLNEIFEKMIKQKKGSELRLFGGRN